MIATVLIASSAHEVNATCDELKLSQTTRFILLDQAYARERKERQAAYWRAWECAFEARTAGIKCINRNTNLEDIDFEF